MGHQFRISEPPKIRLPAKKMVSPDTRARYSKTSSQTQFTPSMVDKSLRLKYTCVDSCTPHYGFSVDAHACRKSRIHPLFFFFPSTKFVRHCHRVRENCFRLCIRMCMSGLPADGPVIHKDLPKFVQYVFSRVSANLLNSLEQAHHPLYR